MVIWEYSGIYLFVMILPLADKVLRKKYFKQSLVNTYEKHKLSEVVPTAKCYDKYN